MRYATEKSVRPLPKTTAVNTKRLGCLILAIIIALGLLDVCAVAFGQYQGDDKVMRRLIDE